MLYPFLRFERFFLGDLCFSQFHCFKSYLFYGLRNFFDAFDCFATKALRHEGLFFLICAKFYFLYLYIRNDSFGDLCPSPVPIAIGSSGNPFVPVPIAIGRRKRLERIAGNSS